MRLGLFAMAAGGRRRASHGAIDPTRRPLPPQRVENGSGTVAPPGLPRQPQSVCLAKAMRRLSPKRACLPETD